jgi:crotonobetainyl-CoA:carnitine CoA-transferase CaiB-like acyl-CoA transferase
MRNLWRFGGTAAALLLSVGLAGAAHADELDAVVGAWVAARDRDEVVAAFEEAEAAVAPVYDVRDILADAQYAALGTAVSVPDEDLGAIRMQNVPFRMSVTPGEIRHAGRGHGQDTSAVLRELGLSDAEIEALRAKGVV